MGIFSRLFGRTHKSLGKRSPKRRPVCLAIETLEDRSVPSIAGGPHGEVYATFYSNNALWERTASGAWVDMHLPGVTTPPTSSAGANMPRCSALIALVLACFLSAPAVADQPTKKEIVRQACAATALIVVPGRGTGTGFLVDREERLVITCAYVLGSRTDARVYFPLVRDGQLVAEWRAYAELPGIPAVVLDLDSSRDLCVLQLDRLPPEVAVFYLLLSSLLLLLLLLLSSGTSSPPGPGPFVFWDL
jgi:hypothetical protein